MHIWLKYNAFFNAASSYFLKEDNPFLYFVYFLALQQETILFETQFVFLSTFIYVPNCLSHSLDNQQPFVLKETGMVIFRHTFHDSWLFCKYQVNIPIVSFIRNSGFVKWVRGRLCPKVVIYERIAFFG